MIDSKNEWYSIHNVHEIDSPALVVYADRVEENIRLLVNRVTDTSLLRPHVKSHKMAEVCRLKLRHGITKFKCATIAEAEMLAMENAPDVLLAYQPTGPKILRLIKLVKAYPATVFSCLADNIFSADEINAYCIASNITLHVFIDINAGMGRTGILAADAIGLVGHILQCSNLKLIGLHAYDGHIKQTDLLLRQKESDAAFEPIGQLIKKIKEQFNIDLITVVGGSPTFATHLLRQNVEHSPGTFIWWDWGYKILLPEEPYHYSALVISRVISIVDKNKICTDLGYKAISAENPLPRVHFLNAPNAEPVSHSEEHLVLKVANADAYKIGDVLYGVPVHICPAVSLYEKAIVVEDGIANEAWKVVARDRSILI